MSREEFAASFPPERLRARDEARANYVVAKMVSKDRLAILRRAETILDRAPTPARFAAYQKALRAWEEAVAQERRAEGWLDSLVIRRGQGGFR